MEKDRWVLPTTTSMDFLRLVVVWVGGARGGGGGRAILAVSSGAEEAQLPHRRLPWVCLCQPPAGP